MKRKSLIVAMSLITLLCGCTNSHSNSTVKTFKKDDNTLTREAASAWIVNENTTAKDESEGLEKDRHDNGVEIHERDNLVGELILDNNDNSVDYQVINGSDVVYNGRTYRGLYGAATQLAMPYKSTTFINFVLKTYNTSANEIFVLYSSDLDKKEDDVIVSAYSEAKDLLGYDKIASKYGEDINWYINIHERLNKNAATLYGCSKYIIYQGNSDNVTIDMSKYGSGSDN